MTTVTNVAPADSGRSGQTPADDSGEGVLARLGLRFTNWAERWFPDAYVFVALAVAVVAAAALHQRRTAGGGRGIVRRRLLEPHRLHDADGDGGRQRLRGGELAARRQAHRRARRECRAAGAAPSRSWRRSHADLAAQLGHEPGFQRPPGARARAAHRSAHGLSRRRRGRVSRPRRDLGARAEFIGRAAAGESRRACPSRCWRSPASSRSPRRSSCGNPW